MIHMQDKMEKLLSSTEEKDREKEETEEEEGSEEEKGSEEEGQAYDDNKKAEREEEAEETAQAADRPEEDPLLAQAKHKKQTDVLNLNNEVVKMRKEVKRVRALIIRKLTRQICALKKKKGKEAEIEKNQRRAARLLEEVHAMKVLTPDLVTKTALQKKLNFEEVCKNTQSSITDRAVARIATHPQFNKKIEDIKAAVKAFKEERMKAGKQAGKEKAQNKCGQVNLQSPDKRGEKPSEKNEEDVSVQLKKISENEDVILEHPKGEAKPEIDIVIGAESADTADVLPKQIPESKRVEHASAKLSNRKDPVKNEPQCKDASKKQNIAVHKKREEEEVSELESSDEEEKEYFDDSTEERFHKQSSQSEESEDDFFVGKVSKFKKRRKQKVVEGERKVEQWQEVKGESNDKVKTSDKVQRELDELESRLKSKATSLQSVFCSSLSGSKKAAGRGRGSDNFRGQRKPNSGSGFNRDFRKQSKFQKQVSGEERNSGSKYSKPCPEGIWQETEEMSFASASRGRGGGRGRGRSDVIRQNMPKSQGAISHQLPQQALHPSWEASKKRKEQQGQIMAFQGKKIKFDDDE